MKTHTHTHTCQAISIYTVKITSQATIAKQHGLRDFLWPSKGKKKKKQLIFHKSVI